MNSLALSPSSKKPISAPPLSPRNGPSFSKAPLSESAAMQSNATIKSSKPRNKRSSVPPKQEALIMEDSTTRRRTHRPSGKSLSTGSFADFRPSKPLTQDSVIILKRGASDNLSLTDPIATLSEEESSHQRFNERFNHYSGDKEPSRSRDSSPSRRRNYQQPSSKARRAQRRKDTEAMVADALHVSDGDLPLGTSPPHTSGNSSGGESSDDVVVITGNIKVTTVSRPDPKKRSKRERVSSSPAATASSSFPLITAAEKASEAKSSSVRVTFAKLPRQGRRGSSPSIEMRPQNNVTVPAPLIPIPYDESFLKATPRTPTSITTSQKTSPLYAGPTFSNSPAPDALPLPSFQSRNLGESTLSSAYSHPPTTPTQASFVIPPRSVSLDMDENIFRMESVNEPNTPIYYHDRSRPRDILPPMVTSHPKTLPQPLSFAGPHVISPMPQSYHLPPKMMTSHTVHNVITHEMTMRLRSMLKIE